LHPCLKLEKMKFIQPILLGLAILVGVSALLITSSTIGLHQENAEKIKLNQNELLRLKESLSETKTINASKLSRERSRNLELEEELKKIDAENSSISSSLGDEKSLLNQMIKQGQESAVKIEEKKSELQTLEDELKRVTERTVELQRELPVLEDQIRNEEDKRLEMEQTIDERQSQLAQYPLITSVMREHFQRSLRDMRNYGVDRPWLEKGESLALSFHSVDFNTGLITLPIGTEEGVREKMIFAVHKQGINLCQIRVTVAERHHSLAEIMPMIGHPIKLSDFEEFNLVVM